MDRRDSVVRHYKLGPPRSYMHWQIFLRCGCCAQFVITCIFTPLHAFFSSSRAYSLHLACAHGRDARRTLRTPNSLGAADRSHTHIKHTDPSQAAGPSHDHAAAAAEAATSASVHAAAARVTTIPRVHWRLLDLVVFLILRPTHLDEEEARRRRGGAEKGGEGEKEVRRW